jgi:antitoxin component of MazEF toxin-antitoxin module
MDTEMDTAIELDDLLAAITEENKHQETDWGEAQGEERW